MVSDEEKKVISTSIWTKGNLLLIQIQNYMENEKINFSEGLPVTTKNAHDGHGYGLKSVRKCVEKYNGSMDITAADRLNLLSESHVQPDDYYTCRKIKCKLRNLECLLRNLKISFLSMC